MATRASFPKICIALGLSDADSLIANAKHEIQEGERFLEFRLDYLCDPAKGIAAIRAITEESPEVTILATCRRKENHGHFNGTIEQQMRVLSSAIDAGARAVDLEIESAEIRGVPLDELRRARLMVSYHNWDGTPALDPIIRRIEKIEADYYKLVTTARKPSDTVRVLTALKPAYVRSGFCWRWARRAFRHAYWRRPLDSPIPMLRLRAWKAQRRDRSQRRTCDIFIESRRSREPPRCSVW